jgi:hypothetical protein
MSDVQLPALKTDEDSFCLAVIEYGGNLAAAYRSVYGLPDENGELQVPRALGKARELISRPEVALRLKQLSEAVQENALISLGSHLDQLAEIRDLCKVNGDLKTALASEVKRGEVVGLYAGKGPAPAAGSDDKSSASVVINMNGTSGSVQAWAEKHGKGGPIVIDVDAKRI